MRRAASIASCLPPPTLADRFTTWMVRAQRRVVAASAGRSAGGLASTDLKLFALTYTAGFFAVSLFLA